MKKAFGIILIIISIATKLFASGENEMNNARMNNFFNKIKNEETVTVVTLGGSITTGFNSNPISVNSWAAQTGKWLEDLGKKNNCKVNFYNRGVSGTDSAFGVARLEDHVLALNPDFVIIEYAMNDQWLDGKVRKRTYESIVRRILKETDAAILALFVNEKNPPYPSNQLEQEEICKYYNIPYVSWKECVFNENPAASFSGYFDGEEAIHPNNKGHEKIAECIIAKLSQLLALSENTSKAELNRREIPVSLNDTDFESIQYYHSKNIVPVENAGWEKSSPVHPEWKKHGNSHEGWQTNVSGAELIFEVTGSTVGITYCESDQFRDAIAWIEREDGSVTQKIPLLCYVSYRNGYYGWAYKELVNDDVVQNYKLHVQCSKRAPKSAEGKSCNITGILVGEKK